MQSSSLPYCRAHRWALLLIALPFLTSAWTSRSLPRFPRLSMDLEAPDRYTRLSLRSWNKNKLKLNWVQLTAARPRQIVKQPDLHGMPWKDSWHPQLSQPYFTAFWNSQLEILQNLTDLQWHPVHSRTGQDMSYNYNDDTRIVTLQASSKHYQSIRCTFIDGKHCQVFTSVWIPRNSAPVFSCDLLQFGTRHVCVCDLQPLSSHHDKTYQDTLQHIRNQYPALQTPMTNRFYDATTSPYFSKQLLLLRQNEPCHDLIQQQLVPALQQYHAVQQQLASCVEDDNNTAHPPLCYQTLQEFDTYLAERDPAKAMLGKAFGQAWADAYVYDILFPHATR